MAWIKRWLLVWFLRRRRERLDAEIHWLQDQIWSDGIRLEKLEDEAREVQSELWMIETPQVLLKPHRPAAGMSQRG